MIIYLKVSQMIASNKTNNPISQAASEPKALTTYLMLTNLKLSYTVLKMWAINALCFLAISTTPVFAANLFVATDGDNTKDGSISQPWASLDFALDQVEAGDTINIRAGTYHEVITQSGINGTDGNHITIQSYNGEQVTFDGTIALSGNWTQHDGNIYKLQLSEPVWQLFVDDEMMMNARWPNARFDDGSVYSRDIWAKGLDNTTTNGYMDTDSSVHDLAAANIDATGAVVIANVRQFDTYTRSVTSHAAGQGAFDYGATTHFDPKKNYYYLQGALSLLDQNKEWHIDAATNMAYFWAAGDGIPTGNIRGRNQQHVIDASNWNYVTFKGIDFFATTLELTSSESITIEDCNFNYGGASKRALGVVNERAALLRLINNDGAGNFVLRNISISNSDSQAFALKGENLLVENSLFENLDWASTEAHQPSGTLVFVGDSSRLSRNTIRNTGTSETVASGGGTGIGTIIAEYNDIYNTGYAQSDGALIQIRDQAQSGSVVHHNWLHDTPKYGIRFDAINPAPFWGDNGFTHHNVIWNSGGAIPKGDDGRHYNNLLFDNTNIDLIILDEVAADGDLSNEFTKTVNNAADTISGMRLSVTPIPGIVGSNFNGANETQTLKNLLRDPANGDFRPVAASSLVDTGDVISDGDYSHPTLGGGVDLGTYEEGNNNYWIPGRQLPAASYPIPFDAGSTTKTDADLMWREGYTATSYNVYFGPTLDSLNAPSGFKGNQSNNIFDPGALTVGQSYYWRIDAITPTGTITGNEWQFRVASAPVFTSISPVADSYVDDSVPDSNKGTESVIKLKTPITPGGADEQRYGFLKFNIDVPGTIISATLRLYNDQADNNRDVNVHTVLDNSWDENLITWNNQPAMGSSMQVLTISGNSWAEFDVLSAISGNSLLSLGLKRAPLNSRRQVASKESSFAPELVIEYINYAPVFTANVLSKPNAIVGVAYSNSITNDVTDVENDLVTFSKISGPEWLQITSDGSLIGTPSASDTDLNTFIVEVSDANGIDTATLNITVDSPVVTLFSDDMESGLSQWTISNTVITSTGSAYSGNKGARIKASSSIETSIDTSGSSGITLNYDRITKNFDSGEALKVEWFDGMSWFTLEQMSDTTWSSQSYLLPAGADNNSAFKIRFITNANKANESGDIDNVVVTGN